MYNRIYHCLYFKAKSISGDQEAWVDKKNEQGCFTQCFLNDAWKDASVLLL